MLELKIITSCHTNGAPIIAYRIREQYSILCGILRMKINAKIHSKINAKVIEVIVSETVDR
jgi:hypothetical protein